MVKNLLVLALLAIAAISAYGDPLSERMKELGLIESEPPKPGSKEWMKSNHGDAFIVELKEKFVVRSPKGDELHSPRVVFDAGPVKYIGIDNGEFGGGLYIDAVKKDEKPFFPGNIHALVPLGDDLYIIEGLAHMGFNGGSVHAIRDYKKPSRPERITLLSSAPEAVLVDEVYANKQSAIVIAGHDSFMILIPDRELLILHHDTFWGSLYPSSIVRYQEHYVFGIRGGVVAVPANFWQGQKRFRYFKPKS
jgi:hypothetical protein